MIPAMSFPVHLARFVLPVALALACGSCKLIKKEEAAPPDAALAVEPAPVVVADAEPAAPPPAAEPEPAPAPAAGKQPGKVSGDGGTSKSDAGVKDAGTSDAGGGGATSAACQSKCQGALQVCVTPSVTEGGLPSLGDPTKCREAFDACIAACK